MQRKRYDLPPLDFIQGFEAAARHASFTKAADELHLTQSAVSRQIKALEESLGVTLFHRQHRALALTEDGERLYRTATEVLGRLQSMAEQMRADRSARQLSITTTTGFAALWLIPRLRRYTSTHPHIDVRISATDAAVNLDRGLVDIAIRYCALENAPKGAIPLFGESILPVCSRTLLEGSAPLRDPADLKHHSLLHLDYPGMQQSWFDWGTWLTALGIGDLKPASSLHFSQYDQMIHAAIAGQGVALGRLPLLNEHIHSGALVAPFEKTVTGTRGYCILTSTTAGGRADVKDFCDWLLQEANSAPA
jgi:DNA-binding transcriptional LysR family regulator